jgi:hypothetical protein
LARLLDAASVRRKADDRARIPSRVDGEIDIAGRIVRDEANQRLGS